MIENATKRLVDKLEQQIGNNGIKGNIFDEIKRINSEMTQRMSMKIDLRRENMVVESDASDCSSQEDKVEEGQKDYSKPQSVSQKDRIMKQEKRLDNYIA